MQATMKNDTLFIKVYPRGTLHAVVVNRLSSVAVGRIGHVYPLCRAVALE